MEKMCRYFYVYQNKTYAAEFQGGFLWSPQFANGGRPHPGYECMKEVRCGDIIFHSVQSAIVAVSRAKSNCYAAPAPSSEFNEWDKNGWRVDVEYFRLPTPWIVRETDKVEMFKIQPGNGPFQSGGRGKQQYLCDVNTPLFKHLLDKILAAQTSQKARDEILKFLNYVFPGVPTPLNEIEDGCKVKATLLGKNIEAILTIDVQKCSNHRNWIGKKVGDVLKVPSAGLSYRVEDIFR